MRCCSQQRLPAIATAVAAKHEAVEGCMQGPSGCGAPHSKQVGLPCQPPGGACRPYSGHGPCCIVRRQLQHTWHSHPAELHCTAGHQARRVGVQHPQCRHGQCPVLRGACRLPDAGHPARPELHGCLHAAPAAGCAPGADAVRQDCADCGLWQHCQGAHTQVGSTLLLPGAGCSALHCAAGCPSASA